MKIVIEFYRTRKADDAHAVLGRETRDAVTIDDAIEVARQLSQTLEMPQRPDAMTITEASGANALFRRHPRGRGQRRKAIIVNFQSNEIELRNTVAIGIWENEGGAPGRDLADHQYGRRVEADRSWTVYHVFTGIPARVGEDSMTGLSRAQATNSMISLNHRNAERRKDWIRLVEFALDASNETVERGS